MNYKGKLYGRAGGEYFDTGKTSEDWDELEANNKYLNQALKDRRGICDKLEADKKELLYDFYKWYKKEYTEYSADISIIEKYLKSINKKRG
jgi:hypothetical protein